MKTEHITIIDKFLNDEITIHDFIKKDSDAYTYYCYRRLYEELTDPIDLKQSTFNKLDQKLRDDIEVFNSKFTTEDVDNREMITIEVKYVGDIVTLTLIHFKGYNVLAYKCFKYNIIQDLVN